MRRSHILLVVVVVMFSLSLWAQAPTATINGRVLDQTRALIAGATVDAVNTSTNIRHSTQTSSEGLFTIVDLLPGDYRVEVSKAGFCGIVKPGVVLHVQDVVALNFEMSVGSTSETVTVEGGTSLINTESAAVSTVIDRNFVANTPLNGRSFQDLISMTPGVVTQNPNASSGKNGQGGDFSVNGQRTEANYYTVDGVSANVAAGTGTGSLLANASGSLAGGTVLGTTQSLVSVDALQEFRVQSSTYSAEYGRAPGGQFSLVTRSGTNSFHGSLFDYIRNDFFDANDWFNDRLGKTISALRQNDFGGTLGGYIDVPGLYNGKDRTFFFFSYEGLRLVQPQAATTSQLVPDLFLRQQATPALQPILNAYPLPNGKDFGTAAAPSLAQFIQPFSLPSQIDSTGVRIDHILGPKLSLFFRFADTPTFAQTRGGGGSASVLSTTNFNTQTYTLGAISQLSPRANSDFRLGYALSDTTLRSTLDSFGGGTPIDLAAAMGVLGAETATPTMQISIPGAGVSLLRENNSANRLRQWNLVDTFSFALGRHQLKLGADYRRIVSPNDPPSPQITASYTSAQSVVNNKSSFVTVAKAVSARPVFNETSAFVQDEWRVGARLTLSLGLRWEVDPPPHGVDGNDAFTLVGDISNPGSLALAPRGTPLWQTSWYNFAPRLGVAWMARNHTGWETVVRAGGGVYFDTNNQTAAQGFTGLGFTGLGTYSGASLPVTAAQLNITPSVTPPLTANVYAFPSHLQLPYTLQWNLSVQQALGSKQALTLSYVGAAARRMSGQQLLTGLTKFNPIFGNANVVYWTTNLTSDYDAFEAQFQRSVSQGIHALASYTWSHCLDVGSSYSSLPTGPGLGEIGFRRGSCDTDVRHNLQGGVDWELPGVRGNRIVEALTNHWGLDSRFIGRTAFPVALNGRTLIDPTNGNVTFSGVNLVPDQPIYLYGSQFPGGRAVNPAAFALPAGSSMGNASRNFVRGFNAWQINMAVRREFPIREQLHLQFRAEAFNVLNHPNFGAVDSTRTSATFGQATAMLNQGLQQVASQYQQGGPRSMQFTLRLAF